MGYQPREVLPSRSRPRDVHVVGLAQGLSGLRRAEPALRHPRRRPAGDRRGRRRAARPRSVVREAGLRRRRAAGPSGAARRAIRRAHDGELDLEAMGGARARVRRGGGRPPRRDRPLPRAAARARRTGTAREPARRGRRRSPSSLVAALARRGRPLGAQRTAPTSENAGIERVLAAVGPLDDPTLAAFRFLTRLPVPRLPARQGPGSRSSSASTATAASSRRSTGGTARPKIWSLREDPTSLDAPRRPRRGRPAARADGRAARGSSSTCTRGPELTASGRGRSSRARSRSLVARARASGSALAVEQRLGPWNIPVGRTLRWVVLAELGCVRARSTCGCGRAASVRLAAWVALAAALACARAALGALVGPRARLDGRARALTVAALFVAAGAIALRRRRARRARRAQILLAVLAAAGRRGACSGCSTCWADPDRATVPATIGTPVRYNGLGGNPNTMAMLLALAAAARGRGRSSTVRGPRGEGRRRARVRAARRLDRRVGLARRDPRRLRGTLAPRRWRSALGGRSLAVAALRGSVLGANAALTQVPQPRGPGPDPQPGVRRAGAARPGGRAVHPAARDPRSASRASGEREAARGSSRRAAG